MGEPAIDGVKISAKDETQPGLKFLSHKQKNSK